ncbi:DUF742 domain-containing protein [Streptomonospora litoralis]|uniref:DUF742 domain-containing protein n=1 Tax=Streptomonospora litoralis TaxID=2498135 RepID=A0A4P6Q2K1_9ACTN|nr:DUF742 domain-containing protein [Streptomonospora litoralis]QBI53099.1 hypothetical protein EKD16_06505 [Streptomonospora litoralis]
MNPKPIDREDPDRLFTVTGGRSRAHESAFDTVTLIVSECEPKEGMQSEHVRILRICRRPTAVVEISASLGMPVSVVKILLCDLLDTGRITVRHPSSASDARAHSPAPETLKQVLDALQRL